jgi:KDO2-lipid IV(A) lauroyltransferase
VTAGAAVVGRLPRPAAEWLGRRLGDLGYFIVPHRRRLALANLHRAFPERTLSERRSLCRQAYHHLGLTFVELCALATRPVDEFLGRVRLEGVDHLKTAMAVHGRALLLTAHLGNWEVLPAASRLTGYRLAVVVRPLDSLPLNTLAEKVRRRVGVALIHKRRALRPVLDVLAQGGMVGILLDQNTARHEGVFVPFFGRPASTSRSMAVLALRTGAPVLPVFTRREAGGIHRVTIHEPIPSPPHASVETSIVDLTARYTAAIEAAVRETPEQWLWIHDRWRTRPPGE